MSVKVMGLVWDLEMSPDEKFILLAYADHADHEGFSIYPAISTVAKKTSYSERSVQRITRLLETNGYLISDGRGAGRNNTNKWHIPIYGGKIVPTPMGDKMTPLEKVTPVQEKVTSTTLKGDIAMSPESSLTFKEPSTEKRKPNIQIRGIEAAIGMSRPVTEDDFLPETKPLIEALNKLSNLNPNWPHYGEKKDWDRLARQITAAEANGQEILRFVAWVLAQKDADKKIEWYGRKPEQIWLDWGLAFRQGVEAQKRYVEDDSLFVPPPRAQ